MLSLLGGDKRQKGLSRHLCLHLDAAEQLLQDLTTRKVDIAAFWCLLLLEGVPGCLVWQHLLQQLKQTCTTSGGHMSFSQKSSLFVADQIASDAGSRHVSHAALQGHTCARPAVLNLIIGKKQSCQPGGHMHGAGVRFHHVPCNVVLHTLQRSFEVLLELYLNFHLICDSKK